VGAAQRGVALGAGADAARLGLDRVDLQVAVDATGDGGLTEGEARQPRGVEGGDRGVGAPGVDAVTVHVTGAGQAVGAQERARAREVAAGAAPCAPLVGGEALVASVRGLIRFGGEAARVAARAQAVVVGVRPQRRSERGAVRVVAVPAGAGVAVGAAEVR